MVQRTWNHGTEVSFVLFDSWFASAEVIKAIYEIGYDVICQNNFSFLYHGKAYTLNKLYKHVAKGK